MSETNNEKVRLVQPEVLEPEIKLKISEVKINEPKL